jgi:hypothetical protein
MGQGVQRRHAGSSNGGRGVPTTAAARSRAEAAVRCTVHEASAVAGKGRGGVGHGRREERDRVSDAMC